MCSLLIFLCTVYTCAARCYPVELDDCSISCSLCMHCIRALSTSPLTFTRKLGYGPLSSQTPIMRLLLRFRTLHQVSDSYAACIFDSSSLLVLAPHDLLFLTSVNIIRVLLSIPVSPNADDYATATMSGKFGGPWNTNQRAWIVSVLLISRFFGCRYAHPVLRFLIE